jgi:hypothetical protein
MDMEWKNHLATDCSTAQVYKCWEREDRPKLTMILYEIGHMRYDIHALKHKELRAFFIKYYIQISTNVQTYGLTDNYATMS